MQEMVIGRCLRERERERSIREPQPPIETNIFTGAYIVYDLQKYSMHVNSSRRRLPHEAATLMLSMGNIFSQTTISLYMA